MENNTEEAIFHLMQNVIDKLDQLDLKLSGKKSLDVEKILSDKILGIEKSSKNLMTNQNKYYASNVKAFTRIIGDINKITPSVNNYKEYNLIGKEAMVKPRLLLISIFVFISTWAALKYLPTYFNEKSELKLKKEQYQIFYEYIYLKQFDSIKRTNVELLFKKIKNKDSIILKEYYSLSNEYQKSIKINQLKEELRRLK